MITIGVDYHKRTSSYKVIDAEGKSLKACKLENCRENIRQFIQSIPGPKRLGMEATRSWGLYYDCVSDLVDEFHLGHPKKMRMITESETKNDKKDAELIARLLHSGFLPEAHVALSDTRQLRSLLRFRYFLVKSRAALRNQIQTLIDRNIWVSDRPKNFKSPFCLRGLKWLKSIELPPRERFILDGCLKTQEEKTLEIMKFEAYIQSETIDLEGLRHLRTVPGFRLSKVNSLIVLLETDNIQRFKHARNFAHYAGLIPQEYSSGDKHRTGRLVQSANRHLRTALIESTLAAIRADKGLKMYYQQVKIRAGSGPAIIATARKLSLIIYHVLKEQRAYRPYEVPPAADCVPYAVTKN